MLQAAPTALAYWPVLATAGAGLVAWGTLKTRVDTVQKDVDTKASKESVDGVKDRLDSMDKKLDRLLERGAA